MALFIRGGRRRLGVLVLGGSPGGRCAWWALLGWLGLLPGLAAAQAPGWQLAMAATGGQSRVTAVATDAAGNVYLAGHYIGAATFGSTQQPGSAGMFVAKWDPGTRAFAWVRTSAGSGEARALALAVGNSMVYVAGTHTGATTLGSTTLTPPSLTSDGFVAGYTTDGTFSWAQAISSLSPDQAVGLAVSGNRLYVAGDIGGGTAALGGLSLTGQGWGNSGTFVARLTEAGPATTFDWAVAGGAGGGNFTYALAALGPTVYVAGNFISPTTAFGNTTLLNTDPDTRDCFIAKLTDQGSTATWNWVQTIGGPGEEFVYALAATESGLYVGGQCDQSATWGSLSQQSPTKVNGFVAKLLDDGPSARYSWVQPLRGSRGANTRGLAVRGQQVYATGLYLGTATMGSSVLPTGNGNLYVASLLDHGPSATLSWGVGSATVSSSCAGLTLALGSAAIYVGGFGNGTINFGPYTVGPVTNFDNGVFAVLDNSQALAAAPAAASPGPRLYPNPATGPATLAGTAPGGAVRVLDALGREVATTTADAHGTTALPAGLAPGLYVVRAGGIALRWVVQ